MAAVGPPPPPPPGKLAGVRNHSNDPHGEERRGCSGGSASAGQKREDGWLPKAEYEAKKREERARRQREKEQVGAAGTAGDGVEAQGGQSQGRKGRGRGGRDTWQEVMMNLPKKPEPVEETPESRALREAEEARLRCRDRLRGADSATELRAAIAAARELGLTEEVRIGERKLGKMEGVEPPAAAPAAPAADAS